ncbi:MAG: hypothetical protein KBT77_10470 [Thalassolituus oleivorans]|uniref:DUF6160 family protein n=1 Tax=Thalassolituus oleivorans TaxID=187493 RepID=UPI001B76FC41|nr:DUF6160 family protein [Thalassolituus oleivorans]MBQ0727760.1 hypothetical protein [Thalassolituus oleivorans]MBQ0780085.1 hypothetical protein [Thalassolituus oleivorans]
MKKIAFSLSVLAASLSAQAELTELADFDLTNVSGQAGVDIILDVALDIGSVQYVDTDTGGGLRIEDIHIGGGEGRTSLLGFSSPGNTSRIDNFKFAIDVLANGQMRIQGAPVAGAGLGVVDFEISTGAISTTAAGGAPAATIVDSINMYGGATGLGIIVNNDNSVYLTTTVGIEDLDIDMTSSLSTRIKDAFIADSDFIGNPFPQVENYTAQFTFLLDAQPDGINIDFVNAKFDMGIGMVEIGDGQIGSLLLDDVNLNGVSLHIAGH